MPYVLVLTSNNPLPLIAWRHLWMFPYLRCWQWFEQKKDLGPAYLKLISTVHYSGGSNTEPFYYLDGSVMNVLDIGHHSKSEQKFSFEWSHNKMANVLCKSSIFKWSRIIVIPNYMKSDFECLLTLDSRW